MRGILIAVLVLAATSFAAENEEWVRPYDPYLPGAEPLDAEGGKKVVAVRLLKRGESSIEPLAGGRVTCWTEETLIFVPAAKLVAEAKTDEFGIANLRPIRGGGDHWHFEGPGCGTVHEFHTLRHFDDGQVTLGPGIEVPAEILGPFGKPLAGADTEIHLGCPHSPPIRRGRTDEKGRITFRDLDDPWSFRFWIRAPGIDFGPYELDDLTIGTEGRFRVIARPSMTIRGRVLDEKGEPFPGVIVRCHGWRRGPRVVTDSGGRFVLHGVIGAAICLYDPRRPDDHRPSAIVRHYDPEFPLLIRLREGRPTAMGEGEIRHHVEVLVRSTMPSTDGGVYSHGEDKVTVRLVRTSDGLVLEGRSGRDRTEYSSGFTVFAAPPGDYRVRAGGGFERFPTMEATLRVPRETAEPVHLTKRYADRQPYALFPKATAEVAGGLTLHLPRQHRFWDDSVHVPAKGPLAVAMETPVPVVLRAELAEGDRRPFVWESPKPTRVRVRFDPDLPENAEAHLLPRFGAHRFDPGPAIREAKGTWVFRTFAAGPARIRVVSETLSDPWHPVTLPNEGGSTLDVGVVTLRPLRTRTFRIDAPGEWWVEPLDGSEVDDQDGTTVTFSDSGRELPVRLIPSRFPQEGEPGFSSRFLALGPDTPEVVRLPAGRITATVTGSDGPILAVVFLDHDELTFPDGKVDIRGVADGPHILIVGARGHRGEVRRIVIRNGETRNLEIRLPRRISKK